MWIFTHFFNGAEFMKYLIICIYIFFLNIDISTEWFIHDCVLSYLRYPFSIVVVVVYSDKSIKIQESVYLSKSPLFLHHALMIVKCPYLSIFISIQLSIKVPFVFFHSPLPIHSLPVLPAAAVFSVLLYQIPYLLIVSVHFVEFPAKISKIP